MMGFTWQEVEWLMDETGVNRDFITIDMEWHYNGYLFHEDAADRIYNPSMMLYFFEQIIREQKAPKKIIDDNLKIDNGRLQRLTQNVSRHIFNKLSNCELQKFDEKYIKIMLMDCLFQSNAYIPVCEIETNTGYVDIYLRRSPLLPEVKYEWLFELKYFVIFVHPDL